MTATTTRDEFQAAHVTTVDSAQYILEQLKPGMDVEIAKVHCLIFLIESLSHQRFDIRFHDDDFVKTSSNLVKGEKFGNITTAYAATSDRPFLHKGQNLGGKPHRLTKAHTTIISHIIHTYGNRNVSKLREMIETDAYVITTDINATLSFEI